MLNLLKRAKRKMEAMKQEHDEDEDFEGCGYWLLIPAICLTAIIVALTVKFILWLF